MSAETWWIVGCVVLGVVGLWLALRGRRAEVVGGDQKPAATRPVTAPRATTLSPLDHHVRKLVAEGHKIEAIKAVREHTGLGLKEAKDYVEAIPNVAPLANFGRPAEAIERTDAESVRREAIALKAQNKMMEAIKLVRERTGLGLKEAKDYVDALAVPTKQQGFHAMLANVTVEELAESKFFRTALDRAFKAGKPEDELVAEMARLTGRSEADMRAVIALARPGNQSPIV
jgi:ribosomal protein L7/L12